jgi:predicted nucleic acid-binding protein
VAVLVDTSVWVDHLRRSSGDLVDLLHADQVNGHPFVIGELACGTLARREEVLALLGSLEPSPVLGHDEALHLIERNRLWGTGLGWIDVHLIGSCLVGGHALWTRDRSLADAATLCGVEVV